MSVTEEEVHRGILRNESADTQCFFFRRDIDKIDHCAENSGYNKFVDVVNKKRDTEAKQLQEELKSRVQSKLHTERYPA